MILRLSPSQAAQITGTRPKRSKYGAVRVDGFDSQREATVYQTLRVRELAGQIRDLRRQPVFVCQVNGLKVCEYRSDFLWTDSAGDLHVADVKGFATREFRLKAKLVRALFGIEIEVLR